MAGHSKWANIRHRKGLQDAKRGKAFTKLLKEIAVAAKSGGPDPDSNPRLRAAIQSARGQNVPKDNIDKAIKKACGGEGQALEEATFEGYGPEGSALYIECATDNKARTVGSVRSYFRKFGGNLGKDGCLEFVFSRKGVFILDMPDNFDEEEFTLELIDAGAEEVEAEDGQITVISAMEDYGQMAKQLHNMGLEPREAGLQRLALERKNLSTQEVYQTFIKLLDALEDDDDIQKVYHNVEFRPELSEIIGLA